jgi:hypothetical protein
MCRQPNVKAGVTMSDRAVDIVQHGYDIGKQHGISHVVVVGLVAKHLHRLDGAMRRNWAIMSHWCAMPRPRSNTN